MRQLIRILVRAVVNAMVGKLRYQRVFEILHDIALRGMNYKSGDLETSGELHALGELAAKAAGKRGVVVVDVGANVGAYSVEAARAFRDAGCSVTVYAFEPSKAAFQTLSAAASEWPEIAPRRLGLGEREGTLELHYDRPGSTWASIYSRDLSARGVHLGERESIQVTTLDAFCEKEGVDHIDLLKIDTEGHELAVLDGARGMLARGGVDAVQFEFGDAAMDARHYLRDFYQRLPGYRFARVTRDGLRFLDGYKESDEIFLLINFMAVRVDGPFA